MYWLESQDVMIIFLDTTLTCVDDEGETREVKGIPKPISVRWTSTTQLKKCARKGCELFAIQIANARLEDTKPSIEKITILKEF